jgi:hypothetical protein
MLITQICRLVLAVIAIAGACNATAQSRADCESRYQARSGQAGKDVIWVPTQDVLVTAMLKAAKVAPDDLVIDLGAGDGKIPIAAAKEFGAKAIGIEYNPQLVQLAQCYVKAEGLVDQVQIREADIFETDLSQASVVTMYLLSALNLRLRPALLQLKPGTRIVSNSFDMGDWTPDQSIDAKGSYAPAYLWYVPARVDGAWMLREEGGDDQLQLHFEQQYQHVQADSSADRTIQNVRLRGAQIEFELKPATGNVRKFSGVVDGERMRLESRRGGRAVIYVGVRMPRS